MRVTKAAKLSCKGNLAIKVDKLCCTSVSSQLAVCTFNFCHNVRNIIHKVC